jgi:protein required for attachment to host cells
MTYWILIADASGARVFSTDSAEGLLHLERELDNPQGRARTQELVTDEPGRLRKGGIPGVRSAMDPRTTAHQAAGETFASQLAAMLDKEAQRGRFDALAVVAPPHFLGLLRSRLSKKSEQLLRATLDRDLVHVRPEEIRPHLDSLFVPGVFAQ